MISNSCLKSFHAAVMCALVASTQPHDSPIMSLRCWKVGTASIVSSLKCTWVEFKLSVGTLSPLHFLHLNMLSFFSVPLTPKHLLWIQRLQVWQSIEFTPTPLEHTPQVHLTFLVGFWATPEEPSILVLPTFILRPRVSRVVLQACTWIFKSSKLSRMITRSSAYRRSQGQPITQASLSYLKRLSFTWGCVFCLRVSLT